MTDLSNERFLRISECAALSRVSNATIKAWLRKGKFPAPVYAEKRFRLWLKADVEKFLLNGTVGPVVSSAVPDAAPVAEAVAVGG